MTKPNSSELKWWNIVVGCLILFPALKFPIDVQGSSVPYALFIYIARAVVIIFAARLVWSGVQHQRTQIR
jgi:hypothetical protein